MEFRKYGSIENSYRIQFTDLIKSKGLHAGEYIVQEKVHGANFSFWCDGNYVRCAKRTSFLSGEEEQKFNGAAQVLKDHYQKIMMLFQNVKAIHGDLETLTLCGELIGGQYPHPDVKRVEHAVKVQKGVYYCPHNIFYGFDILVNGKLLEQRITNMFFESSGIFHAKTIFSGTFDECLQYPNAFDSHIPGWLGLPSIADNVCEGTIIRPNIPVFLGNGSRVILKNKNEKWEEKSKEQSRAPKIADPMTGDTLEAFHKISEYVTENRLKNVLSKLGPVTNKDFGKLSGMFNADVIEEFNKEHNDFNVLDKSERKRVTKEMSRATALIIRENFLNIIDGEF